MRHLNFITDIQRIPVENLPFDALLGNKTFSLPDNLDWEKVTFKRPAKLEITEKVDDKVHTYTHKLTYSTCEEDIDTDTIYAYLVTDMLEERRSVMQAWADAILPQEELCQFGNRFNQNEGTVV